jgi:hypothetical protein
MSRPRTVITAADLLAMDDYAAQRTALRRQMVAHKQHRRLAVGPYAMLHFESFATVLAQVHEMLFIERGGVAQLADELDAYNPLVPNGRELVATLMFEIEDERRRERVLRQLGRVEDRVSLQLGDQHIVALPEADVDRTTADGKTSAVHFLHFAFTPPQIAAFRAPGAKVIAVIDHPAYGHAATLPEAVRQALADDFL